MSREKTLVKNTLLYMVGNFASKFLGFLLLPLYTRYLSTEDYGYYDLVFTTTLMLVPILSFQIYDGMYRFLLSSKSKDESEKIITNTIIIAAVNTVAFIVLGLLFLKFSPIKFGEIIIFQIAAIILNYLWQQMARGLKLNTVYTISGVVYTLIILMSNIFLIVFLKMGIDALLYSNIAGALTSVIYIEWKVGVHKYFKYKLRDGALCSSLMRFSLPLLPNSLNWWIMSFSSRYIITYFDGMEGNGLFAVASKFPAVLMLVNSIFSLSWQESAITEYDSKDKDEFYSQIFSLYMRIQFCAMFVLLPFTKLAMEYAIDPKFYDAWVYIPLLYLGAVFSAFSTFYGTGYLSSKETKGAFTTSIIGAVVNLTFNILLIPFVGIQAACVSNMTAFLIMWVLRIRQTKKYFKIKIDMPALAALSALTVLFVFLYLINIDFIVYMMIIASLIVFAYFNRTVIGKILRGIYV